MYLDHALLELQAGLLSPTNYPRLAAEAIAAGREGPEIKRRLLQELGVPDRSRMEAAWEMARTIAKGTLDGGLTAWDGAGELTTLAREIDDRVRDFLRLLAVCAGLSTSFCAGLRYTLHGVSAVQFFTSFGLLLGRGATLFGWWFARYSWSRREGNS